MPALHAAIGRMGSGQGTAHEYVNPDPDGNGIAYNGLPVFTTEQAITQLNPGGEQWSIGPNGRITYTFLNHAPSGQYNTPNGQAFAGLGSYTAGFSPFTPAQREAARDAIQLWDDLIAPSFVETRGRGAADISYMNTTTGPAQASAFVPFGDTYVDVHPSYHRFDRLQGDTFVNSDEPSNFDLAPGGYGFTALVHETGHAIGLSHPGDYNFSDDEDGDGFPDPITYAGDAVYFQDSNQYTIMSYFNAENTGAASTNWATGYYHNPQTPMLHDIAAVQAIYGADLTTRTGNTTYGFNSNADRDVFDFTTNLNPYLTIYDAGGHDTLDFSGWTRNSVLDLNDGAFSSGHGTATPPAADLNAYWSDLYESFGYPPNSVNLTQVQWNNLFSNAYLTDNISIAYGTIIEDGITGSGHDRLIGNEQDNRLDGGRGQDTYTGGAGADTFVIGHAGNLDLITDFSNAVDTLDLSAFGTTLSALSFVGNDIRIDLDNNGVVDLIIRSSTGPIAVDDIFLG